MMPIRNVAMVAVLLLVTACSNDDTDAWGTFEAVEVQIAAEVPGRVMELGAREGDQVAAGAMLARIDTVPLALQRAELAARARAVGARIGEVDAGIASLEGQIVLARREQERLARLASSQAATIQQLERAERELGVLVEQRKGMIASRSAVVGEVDAIAAQQATIADRIVRTVLTSPRAGTVLVRMVEEGELVQPGSRLYTIAALDTVVLRAYLSGGDLPRIRLGDRVTIRIDGAGGGLDSLPGTVTWIASRAEFTPTPIQTRDERVTEVYAVKIDVPNPDGRIRIGMPGELVLPAIP